MNYDEPSAEEYLLGGEADPAPQDVNAAGLTPPVNWWLLDESEKQIHLERVTNFTLRLVRSYKLTTEIIVPCWHQHEEMIQELLALCQYRNDQQFIPAQTAGAAIDFHEKFAVFRQRIKQWVSDAGCTGTRHIATAPSAWAVPGTAAFAVAEQSRIDWAGAL